MTIVVCSRCRLVGGTLTIVVESFLVDGRLESEPRMEQLSVGSF